MRFSLEIKTGSSGNDMFFSFAAAHNAFHLSFDACASGSGRSFIRGMVKNYAGKVKKSYKKIREQEIQFFIYVPFLLIRARLL
jgi:hypothetical protein